MLSKLAGTKKNGKYWSILRQVLLKPSSDSSECMALETEDSWMIYIMAFPKSRQLPTGEAKGWECRAPKETFVGKELFRKEYSRSLLKCVTPTQVKYILRELHEDICEYHSRTRTMVA